MFFLEETSKVIVRVHPLVSEQRIQCTVCESAYEQQIAAVHQFNYLSRALSTPFSKKTTCKRSCTRFQGLSSTVPFSVGYITEFVLVNRRFHLEQVLVSNRAVPSLLTCKRALWILYVVIQFHPWLKFYFLLFKTHYHTLPWQCIV